MTLIDSIRLIWLIAGITSVYFAWQKLSRARHDARAHRDAGGNGAVEYVGSWRIRSARRALYVASSFLLAASLAVLDWILTGVSLGLLTVIALTLAPVLFAWWQFVDGREHQAMLQLIATQPGRARRTMDVKGKAKR